jgi:hypothetical protein
MLRVMTRRLTIVLLGSGAAVGAQTPAQAADPAAAVAKRPGGAYLGT